MKTILTVDDIRAAAAKHVGTAEDSDEQLLVDAQYASFQWGARWALTNTPVWRDSKKDKPTEDGLYIVITKDGGVGKCKFAVSCGWYDDFFGTVQKLNHIKYWQSIPKTPED